MSKKKYNQGVKDSLRILYQHINTIEYSTGFRASRTAQEQAEIMKLVYNNIGSLIVEE